LRPKGRSLRPKGKEWDKMVSGELYDPRDPHLTARRMRARELLRHYNGSTEAERGRRDRILRQLLGLAGDDLWIEPPFFCDYGTNIQVGHNVFFNFNCVVLDVAEVALGDRVFVGPAVQIYTADHLQEAAARRADLEFGRPVRIGSDVWIGGGALILPGVSIGSRSVIGAGSVVTRDVPDDVLAAGNPTRIIRELGQDRRR